MVRGNCSTLGMGGNGILAVVAVVESSVNVLMVLVTPEVGLIVWRSAGRPRGPWGKLLLVLPRMSC